MMRMTCKPVIFLVTLSSVNASLNVVNEVMGKISIYLLLMLNLLLMCDLFFKRVLQVMVKLLLFANMTVVRLKMRQSFMHL